MRISVRLVILALRSDELIRLFGAGRRVDGLIGYISGLDGGLDEGGSERYMLDYVPEMEKVSQPW